MIIRNGWNDKELKIKVSGHRDSDTAELWIEFSQDKIPQETLSYLTFQELIDLKKEIEKAIKQMAGLKE